MRKILEVISLAALVFLLWISYDAVYGPHRLSERVPTHFDLAGHADGWGSPAMLLLFPGIALFLYLLMTVASRYPAAFNYPVRVTPKNQARLERLALGMIVWLKAEVVGLFTAIQYFSIETVRMERNSLPPGLMLGALTLIFLTIVVHTLAMRRAR